MVFIFKEKRWYIIQNNYIFTKDKYNKVMQYLSKYLFYDANIKYLFNEYDKFGDVYLIGGAIKDIAFFDRIPRDYDIIVLSPNKIELDLPECYIINKNNFGSSKIYYRNFIFDIWNCKDEQDIFDSSIKFNIDGLYINLSKGIYKDELFNQSIMDGVVRIVNNKNTHPIEGRDYERGLKLANDFGLIYDWKENI